MIIYNHDVTLNTKKIKQTAQEILNLLSIFLHICIHLKSKVLRPMHTMRAREVLLMIRYKHLLLHSNLLLRCAQSVMLDSKPA